MCLAVPAKIVSKRDNLVEVEVGGVKRQASLELVPEAKLGDFVLVHAGFAIAVVDEKEAKETLKLLEKLVEAS